MRVGRALGHSFAIPARPPDPSLPHKGGGESQWRGVTTAPT